MRRLVLKISNKLQHLIKRTIEYKGHNILQKTRLWVHYFLKKNVCDQGFFERISPDLDKIPESNGGRYYIPYENKIGIIADEFLFNSYKNIADFIYITPDNFAEYMPKVDFLLIVSAWRGLNNEWRLMGTEGSDANKLVFKVIQTYKAYGKQVIFYSKEDPPNYMHFLPIARQCDIIFTSASEKIEAYKRDCGNERVYVMKFGINPMYHNPIGCQVIKKRDEVLFSGSWVKKYPKRIKEQDIMFKGILSARKKLKIIDRNFELDNSGFFFPIKYYRYISPSIPHQHLQKVHKIYDWAMNINSVTDSETMFANRVYELQANGNLILSNDSRGVRTQFKEVKIVHSINDVKDILNGYDTTEIYRQQMAGVRRVMTDETTFDRVGELLNKIGIEEKQPKRTIAVIAMRLTDKIKKDFGKQTYQYKDLFEINHIDIKKIEKYDMITFWGENREYGFFYLEDMINAFKYTNSDFVTKNCFVKNGLLNKGVEHNYTNFITDIYATIFWSSSFTYKSLIDYVNNEREMDLENGYSIDCFNYSVYDVN